MVEVKCNTGENKDLLIDKKVEKLRAYMLKQKIIKFFYMVENQRLT